MVTGQLSDNINTQIHFVVHVRCTTSHNLQSMLIYWSFYNSQGPFSKLVELGKAFFSRIWHAVVLTQFGNADSKSAPCQAIFCVFPTQNSKTKWPPKSVKMSQLYITAWLTMNITHHFGVLKPTWATYLKSPEFHLVRLPLEDKIQNGRYCKAMCYNFASK